MTGNDRPANHRKGSTERLLVAIASGRTIIEAAEVAGMSERTARRRLDDPDVAARLSELRASTLTTAADVLATLSVEAASVLGEVMRDRGVNASVRVRAASVLLSRALEARDVAVIDRRLEVLERVVEARAAGGRFVA